MKTYFTAAFLLLFLQAVKGHGFGYTKRDGPDSWGGICGTGQLQSPIDIAAAAIVPDKTISRLYFKNYQIPGGNLTVENNGHSIKLSGFESWGQKQPFIYGGALEGEYVLLQFHIHWSQENTHGSEHTVGGLHYPAEIHFVHRKRSLSASAPLQPGSLAVVGVFVGLSNDDTAFSAFEKAIEQVVAKPGSSVQQTAEYNLMDLLPLDLSAFYTYQGSLTTPGCNEVVVWTVFENPVPITLEQLTLIRQATITHDLKAGFNYRPTQPLNGRKIRYRAPSNIWKIRS